MSEKRCKCEKCMKKRKQLSRKETQQDSSLVKTIKIKSKNTKSIESSKNSNTSKYQEAAIIVMTDDDDLASVGSGKIYFDKGIGNIKDKFGVSKDGSRIEFKHSGLYRIQFEGMVTSENQIVNLEFKRTPDFEESKIGFVKFECDRGRISETTMLPFHRHDSLELIITSSDDSPILVGKSSRLLIIRVDDF